MITRRRRVVALAGKLGLDDRAVRTLQAVRDRYGPGPLRPLIPFRSVAVLLTPEQVRRVLLGSPEPFAAASREKRGALDHFRPHGPGRELVLFTASTFLATLLEHHDARPIGRFPLDPADPLPRALDAFTIRSTLVPAG